MDNNSEHPGDTSRPNDLTDLVVRNGGAKELRRLLDTATPYVPKDGLVSGSKPALDVRSEAKPLRKPIADRIVDLADVEPPGDVPLLFGPYLMRGAAHWLTGATGLGKTTWAMNLCCALAEGHSLWGIQCEQTRILYLDMESGDIGRAIKVQRLYRDAPRVRGHLLFLREPIKLPEELDALMAYVRNQSIGLVVFDTARRCFSVKDENDNAEFYSKIVPTLDSLKQAGIASLTMGHPSKNGNGGARGAGAQEDAGDVNLSLAMHGGADVNDPRGTIALRITKNRLIGCSPPLLLKRIGDDRFERIEAEPEEREVTVTKQMQCRQSLSDALEEAQSALTHGQLSDLAKRAGYSKATFDRCFKNMKATGELCESEGGYQIDPFAQDSSDN